MIAARSPSANRPAVAACPSAWSTASCLNVLAEGGQAPVKPLILVELALLVLAEVSQELGQLGYLSVEPFEAASTAAEGFINFGQPPDRGDLPGQGRHLSPSRAVALLRSWAGPHLPVLSVAPSWAGPHSPAASCSLSVAPRRAGQDDDVVGRGQLPRPGGS